MKHLTFMTKTMILVLIVILTSVGSFVSSSKSKVSNVPSQKSSAIETKLKATNGQSIGGSIIFNGICDGSAAVKLGNKTILVAYDEINTLFAFAQSGGMPSDRIDLLEMLNLETSDEIDIEAATRSGKQIWWIGSHGLDGDGKVAPNRRILFSTNIPSPDLSDMIIVTEPLDLTDILLSSSEVAKVLTESAVQRLPKEGGINIEGIATNSDGGLLVGFRSPLSGENGMSGNAIIVSLLPKDETFEVQRINLLSLDNRGIRDIANNGLEYMIVAGPVPSGGKFALYTWDGIGIPQLTTNLERLNAEGILDLGSHWLILSDDGKMKRADNEANDGERKCDKIRKKNSKGEAHPSVFFRTKIISK